MLPILMRNNGTFQRFETKKAQGVPLPVGGDSPLFLFFGGVGLNINDAQLSLFWINCNRWLPVCTP